YHYTAPPSVTVSDHTYDPTPAERTLFAPRVGGAHDAMLAEASNELCGPDGPRHGQLVCADIEALVAALDAGACSEIPNRANAIKRALHGSAGKELEARFLSRLTIARWQACGGGQQADTEGDSP